MTDRQIKTPTNTNITDNSREIFYIKISFFCFKILLFSLCRDMFKVATIRLSLHAAK